MLRGIEGVIGASEMEIGRFFLEFAGNESVPRLLQRVDVSVGRDTASALYFSPDDEDMFSLGSSDEWVGTIALPSVFIRVDAPTAMAANGYFQLQRDMLIVSGTTPIAVAHTGYRGYVLIDLTTGKLLEKRPEHWVAFKRWQIVMDDEAGEIVLADFEYSKN